MCQIVIFLYIWAISDKKQGGDAQRKCPLQNFNPSHKVYVLFTIQFIECDSTRVHFNAPLIEKQL